MFNSNTPNQHSLPSRTSFYHLKLWPYSRQIVQHISWSQGHSTSLYISKSIFWTSTSVWTVPDSIIRLPSLLSLLSSSVCIPFHFALQKSKWLPLTVTLQLRSHRLGHPSTRSRVSVTRWPIRQMRHDDQDESINEAVHLRGLPLVQSNLPGQFRLSLAQVSSLRTMILIGRMLPLLILILIII